MSVSAAFRLAARRSRRTASSQSMGACVLRRRPTSRTERALDTWLSRSSRRADSIQMGTQSAHCLMPLASVSRAASKRSSFSSSCALMRKSFHARGCALMALTSRSSAAPDSPRLRSRVIDFIHTRSVPARSRALERSSRALSASLFSDSSFTAASHTCSESGFALKASARIARAAPTSPASHFSFAPMSQSTWACGQYETALRSSVSSDSGVPWFFSCCAARTQTDFFVGKTPRACA
mmetsp:Transcript_21393/g.45962  ORF Transcript_21393/g.45962 Transcript_21393/m.45962 type:complete len:238 (-) Transcript_21393:1618-2331(-)